MMDKFKDIYNRTGDTNVCILEQKTIHVQYDSSLGVKALIEVATEAASGVLDTLNSNDRVGVPLYQRITELHSNTSK